MRNFLNFKKKCPFCSSKLSVNIPFPYFDKFLLEKKHLTVGNVSYDLNFSIELLSNKVKAKTTIEFLKISKYLTFKPFCFELQCENCLRYAYQSNEVYFDYQNKKIDDVFVQNEIYTYIDDESTLTFVKNNSNNLDMIFFNDKTSSNQIYVQSLNIKDSILKFESKALKIFKRIMLLS